MSPHYTAILPEGFIMLVSDSPKEERSSPDTGSELKSEVEDDDAAERTQPPLACGLLFV